MFAAIHVHNPQNVKKPWAGELPTGIFPTEPKYWQSSTAGIYVRFHGMTGQYVGDYGRKELLKWVNQLAPFVVRFVSFSLVRGSPDSLSP
jgi:uncharacterized protein YecE (DUF72 family)